MNLDPWIPDALKPGHYGATKIFSRNDAEGPVQRDLKLAKTHLAAEKCCGWETCHVLSVIH